jgi:oxygen-dependent protoporphyrinogen oxidase
MSSHRERPMQPVVCVVGGGIAGLAAAHRLASRGADVVLFEREQLGGKIRTSDFAGRPVDEAADAFLVRVPWAKALAAELGLDDQLVSPAARSAYVYAEQALRPLPEAQLFGVPTDVEHVVASGLLSPAGIAALRRDLTEPGPPPVGDETIGGFIRRRLGEETLERLVGPLVGGVNAGDVDALSLAAVAPQIDAAARDTDEPSLVRAAAAARARVADAPAAIGGIVPAAAGQPPIFAAPRRGMSQLVDALAAELATLGVAIHLGSVAEELVPAPNGRGWAVRDSVGKTTDVDAVVLATPAAATGGLLEPLAPGAGAFFTTVRQASVALLTLAVRPDDVGRQLDGSGFLVPRSEGLLVTACSWSSSKWAHLAPAEGDGTTLLRASVGRADDPRFTSLDDTDLIAQVVDDLTRTMALRGDPTDVRVSRWNRSLPQYAPGHLDHVAAAEAELAATLPTIRLAGASLRGVGIPACILSGQTAADAVLATLDGGSLT